jgi:hypothetical protein
LKHEIPAFAGAALRRQAKLETISNDKNPKRENRRNLENLTIWICFGFRYSDFGFFDNLNNPEGDLYGCTRTAA